MSFLIPIMALFALALASAVSLHPADRRNFRRRRTWSPSQGTSEAPSTPAASATVSGPIIKQLVWAPVTEDTATNHPQYPTLAAIDRVRGTAQQPFATAPNADALEMRARELVDEYWSEMVWLTGLIDEARFDALCAALENSRPMPGQDVELVVVRGLKVQAHEVAPQAR
jgi:hypothetical protein